MLGSKPDVEAGEHYVQTSDETANGKRNALLPTPKVATQPQAASTKSSARYGNGKPFGFLHLSLAFAAGFFSCALMQLAAFGPDRFRPKTSNELWAREVSPNVLAAPYAGSTERHNYPPATPTNAYPSLFPTNVGYPGGTPTGAEPAVLVTAPSYPLHTGAAQLVKPNTFKGKKASKDFDLSSCGAIYHRGTASTALSSVSIAPPKSLIHVALRDCTFCTDMVRGIRLLSVSSLRHKTVQGTKEIHSFVWRSCPIGWPTSQLV